MPFTNYLCWKPDLASDLLDTEAEQHSPEFFSATHSPVSAQKMFYNAPGDESAGILSPGETITEQSILAEFMLGASDFNSTVKFDGNILMPIIGASGSGKTHLIKWLKAKIQNTAKRKVLLVPRIKVSLKQILDLMLNELTGEKFEEFRSKLLDAPLENIDHEANKDQLISQIAHLIGSSLSQEQTVLRDYLRKGLNALFTDPFFRTNWWLLPGGFIDRVTANIIGNNNVIQDLHNNEKPLDFIVDDLPKDIYGSKEGASDQAYKFYAQLWVLSSEDRTEIVALVNLSLQHAVRNLLKLGGVNDLEKMMIQVRQHYKRENIELVVLIEDFARLQGVDKVLLGALLARKQQSGEDDLCTIRTAFACTRDVYDKLPDTVKTRATLNIKVGGLVDDYGTPIKDWSQFAGRYLNAVRRFAPENPENTLNTINPCVECKHQTNCHKAFGTVNIKLNDNPDQTVSVIGLYPLNEPFLKKTYDRFITGPFIPRAAIKNILTPILASHGKSINNGTFPTPALVKDLKGLTNSPITVTAETRSRLGKLRDGERQINLVDLWSSTTDERGVTNDVRSAFAIGKIEINQSNKPPLITITPVGGGPTVQPVAVQSPPFDNQTNGLIATLDLWADGQPLTSQNVANLREYVFKVIEHEIDWVGNSINQKFHAHQTKALFRGMSICFNSDAITDGQVRLRIPPDGADKAESAIALQALIKRKSTGSWHFPDGRGVTGYITAQTHIHNWAADVLKQIVTHYGPNTVLDPIAPAVESLCLAHILNGKTLQHGFNDMTAIEFLFQKIDTPNTARAQKWHDLQDKLSPNINIVRTSLLNLVGCTKGDGQTFMVAADRVLPLIRRALENYKPTDFKLQPLERAGDGSEGIALRRCNQFLREDLEGAVADEIKASADCCTALEDLFGLSKTDRPSAETISNALQKTLEAVNKAKDLGNLAGNLQVDQLRNSIETLRLADLGNLLETCRLVRKETGCNQLPVAANVDALKRQAVVKEVKNLSACLSATELRLTEECAKLTKNTGIDSSITEIVKSLNSLKQVIKTLRTGSIR